MQYMNSTLSAWRTMLYLFSEDLKHIYELKKAFLSKGLYCYPYMGRYDKFKPISGFSPEGFIVDAPHNRKAEDKICEYLHTHFSESLTMAILTPKPYEPSRYRYLHNSDFEVLNECPENVAELVNEYLEKQKISKTNSFRLLNMGDKRSDTTLMSLSLKLTQTEYRILKFLCLMNGQIIHTEHILNCCFADSYKLTLSNIPTHISSINRKAEEITSRRLIISKKGIGYLLNPHM